MSYLDADAELIRRCVPAGTGIPEDCDDLFVLYAVLMRAKGQATQASDVHDAWSAWMSRHRPGHDSIRPFDQLAPAVRAQDTPFLTAIHSAARARAEQSQGSCIDEVSDGRDEQREGGV